MPCERVLQAAVAYGNSRCTGHHYEIEADQLATALAKVFPHQAFEPIAVDRTSDLFLRDRHTQARSTRCARRRENREIGIG